MTATSTRVGVKVYVLTREPGEVVGVFDSAVAAISFVTKRQGETLDWSYHNSHGQMWKSEDQFGYWAIQESDLYQVTFS